MSKLKPEIKSRWVAALRSGEYQQGIAALRPTSDTFCCLGVLCDVVMPEMGLTWGKSTSRKTINGQNGNIPSLILEYISDDINNHYMFNKNPCVDNKTGYEASTSLTALNDSGNATFSQIADLIEEQL